MRTRRDLLEITSTMSLLHRDRFQAHLSHLFLKRVFRRSLVLQHVTSHSIKCVEEESKCLAVVILLLGREVLKNLTVVCAWSTPPRRNCRFLLSRCECWTVFHLLCQPACCLHPPETKLMWCFCLGGCAKLYKSDTTYCRAFRARC